MSFGEGAEKLHAYLSRMCVMYTAVVLKYLDRSCLDSNGVYLMEYANL